MRALVTGAGGFIGGHLVADLLDQGWEVRAVDVKPRSEWWQLHPGADGMLLDLRERFACKTAVEDVDRVYNLAADMGGIGFIESHKADCMLSVLINTHLLDESRRADVERFLFTSSACVYGEGVETAEANAYPAECEDGYGWEKLFSERMCRHFTEDYGLETRVARLHNVYGPNGTWEGGREKAPAALCRKVAEAKQDGADHITLWGDGNQTRSFMHVADCIEGLGEIMENRWSEPVNLGSSELVTVSDLAVAVADIAGVQLRHEHDLDAPQGVRGRNSDNTLIKERYGWEPSIRLEDGLVDTYEWISDQVNRKVDYFAHIQRSEKYGPPTPLDR